MDPIRAELARPDGLGDRLRILRERAGLQGKVLAEAVGWQASKISRIENGRQRPTLADLQAWVRACGAGDATLQALLPALEDLNAVHRDWRRRMRHGQVPVQAGYNELVERAGVVRHFETALVPGLLQTPDYARRVLAEMVELHGLATVDVDQAVAIRMHRQRFLYDRSKSFEFLLAEPVLHWRLCPPAAMSAQLDRLQTVIGLPNVRFGILPFGIGLPVTPQNSFQLYDGVALVETFVGETAHRGTEAESYSQVLDRLWTHAVTEDRARALLVAAAQALRPARSGRSAQ